MLEIFCFLKIVFKWTAWQSKFTCMAFCFLNKYLYVCEFKNISYISIIVVRLIDVKIVLFLAKKMFLFYFLILTHEYVFVRLCMISVPASLYFLPEICSQPFLTGVLRAQSGHCIMFVYFWITSLASSAVLVNSHLALAGDLIAVLVCAFVVKLLWFWIVGPSPCFSSIPFYFKFLLL